MGVTIAGLGSYLPEGTLTNDDLSKLVETNDEWIVSRTGIRSRHQASPGQATSDLALPASRQALAAAGLKPEDLDLIVLATSTADTPVPPTACWLQHALGAFNAPAFDVSAACTGFLYAMHVGAGLIRGGMHRNVLVVGAETLTRMTDYSDRASCILFGDGAGAAVLAPGGDIELMYSSIAADGRAAEMIQIEAGGSRLPASIATVESHQHYIKLKGNEVFKRAVQTMAQAARTALAEMNLTVEDIAWFLPHQANQRITVAVASALELPMERVVSEMSQVGNTAAASLPVALSHLVESRQIKPGDRLMLVGFGAGATWGCQVYQYLPRASLRA
jgi:3-oxoacyl-[acyl-carrier-protein] synthase-3